MVYCTGLFLSARWFVLSQVATKGLHLVVLPDKESAEYCCSDLYNLTEGDRVFFLPESGISVERSNYKSSLGVQRTSALGKISESSRNGDNVYIVSYPEGIEEPVPSESRLSNPLLSLSVGDEISHDSIEKILFDAGFEQVDFVSEPGQFTLRGGVVDIFSYSLNMPYRFTLFGDEIEKIHIFDCNTQLSKEKVGIDTQLILITTKFYS